MLASRLGLGRPLRRTPDPSQDRGRLPTRREVSGHYPTFATTTSRLTPRRASAGVSRCGYRIAYRPGRSDRPGHTWTTGRQLMGWPVCAPAELLGPYEVSPDHPDGVVAACQPQPPPDAPTVKGPFLLRRKRPGGGVIGFPAARSVATSGGLTAVHFRSGPRLCLRPLQTPGHPDALGIGYSNFNGQSSGRTLTSSSSELLGVHATEPPDAPGALSFTPIVLLRSDLRRTAFRGARAVQVPVPEVRRRHGP